VPYAVTLRLHDDAAAAIDALWHRLADEGVSDSMAALGYRPHLTLAIATDVDVPAAIRALERFAATHAALAVPFVGIGAFLAPARVLWAAPRVDRALLDLQAALHETLAWPAHPHYASGTWVPHCTLAEDLSAEAFAHAARLMADHWQPTTAMLDRIELVRFRPVEILWQQPLRSRAGA
jgi:2'-5' RNA ligase